MDDYVDATAIITMGPGTYDVKLINRKGEYEHRRGYWSGQGWDFVPEPDQMIDKVRKVET